ncbi:MAG: DUF6011 domain-containing protein [Nitrosopumilaceae archaeon]|nr:DUF6011 domain-containing protein [Nitrosopumilaceae archaeon]
MGFECFSDLSVSDEQLEKYTRESKSKYSKTEKFPCTACGGTGHYRGVRVYQEKSHCFSCKGKGYFLTSPDARAKAKAKRDEKKSAKKAKEDAARKERIEAFKAEHRELMDFLIENMDWNGFFNSLVQNMVEHGNLTEGQLNAAYKSMEKIKAKREAKDDNRLVVDLSKLNEIFKNASENLKKPVLRFEDIVVSKAPDHGRNAGFLYVKFKGEYAGKINPEGKFFKIGGTPEEVESQLIEFCKAPMEAAIKYGRKTGSCACCGRELTNKDSIELGIGPICAENWF